MAYNRTSAKTLLTSAELELYDIGRRDSVTHLDRRTLVAKVMRTRKLRDKYRDLFRRQRLATRDRTGSKRGLSGAANLRTKEKAALFDELLKRFEAQLAKVDAAAKLAVQREMKALALATRAALAAARKGPPKKAKGLAGKASGAKAAGFMNVRAKQAAAKRQLQKSRTANIHAHLRSQGKRRQAKRDSRPR